MRHRPGYTLLELTLVLLIATLLLSASMPAMLRVRSVLSVRAARADIVAAIAGARAAAILSGGARVIIDAPSAIVWVETEAGRPVGDPRPLGSHYGVTLEMARARDTLRYDALGIGRMANAAFEIRRGAVSAALTVSAYGRVRS